MLALARVMSTWLRPRHRRLPALLRHRRLPARAQSVRDDRALPEGLPERFYDHHWEFFLALQIAVADQPWVGNPAHTAKAKQELIRVFDKMVTAEDAVLLPGWDASMVDSIVHWALACWYHNIRTDIHRRSDLPRSEGVSASGFWWSAWHLANIERARPQGKFTWLHNFAGDRVLTRGPLTAGGSQAPASSSQGAAQPTDIDGLVNDFRAGCDRMRNAVTDVDLEWGDLANAEREFQAAVERALASLATAHREVAFLRRQADDFIAKRSQTQRQVQRWEDKRVQEVEELEALVRRLPAMLAAVSDGAPAAGTPPGAPARVAMANELGFLVEVQGKRMRKSREISAAEAGTLCSLLHAILGHGRAVQCVSKELLDQDIPGRSLDLRPHVRWARGWCETSILACELRLEVDVLYKILREDSTKSHRWGYSADGTWVYSSASNLTVLHNIQLDMGGVA